jgi:hypothetical protein
MGGSSQQGETAPTTLGSQNPLTGVFNNLFGVPTRIDVAGGGIALGDAPYRGGANFSFADPLFGPGSFGALEGILDPVSLGEGAVDIGGLVGRTAAGQQELAETGFKSDIGAATDLSRMLFEQEFIPGALEQFGASGLDARDSDVQAALLREGSRRATELGALDLDLSEAAADRRVMGLQAAPGVLDLQNLGLTSEFAQTEAGQLLGRLLDLGGFNTQTAGAGGGGGDDRKGGGILFG